MSKENGANNGADKKGFARFMHWYESYQGKRVVGLVYSIGAAVVIIGALFKIMHFPGAGAVLMVGMITEAILFLIGCLDKPHAEFHWHNVFPQLLEHGTDPALLEEMQSRPKPTLMGGDATASATATAQPKVPMLPEKDLAALKDGIDSLAKTASQLSELGKVATATTALADKLDAAGKAAEQFVQAGKILETSGEALGSAYGKVTEDMEKVAAGTKEYESQVAAVNKQLSSLNAMYELQLNALQTQVEAVKAQTEKVANTTAQFEVLDTTAKQMSTAAGVALKNQETLAQQVADLNKVYGNMLNALV